MTPSVNQMKELFGPNSPECVDELCLLCGRRASVHFYDYTTAEKTRVSRYDLPLQCLGQKGHFTIDLEKSIQTQMSFFSVEDYL